MFLPRVPTTDLRLGDIVHNYGMRILLDQPPIVWEKEKRHGPGTVTVYSWPGLVLNPDEAIAEHDIPRGWIYDGRGDYDYAAGTWTQPARPAWTVQGNHLARWSVDREHVIGC